MSKDYLMKINRLLSSLIFILKIIGRKSPSMATLCFLLFPMHLFTLNVEGQTRVQRLALIRPGKDNLHFVREGSDERFVVWGVNYDRDDAGRLIEDYWIDEWPTVVQDFQEMKKLGVNVVRIYLQLAPFMKSPTQINEKNFIQLGKLVKLAEQTELYLDITGLGCCRKEDIPVWYDALEDTSRWDVQAHFWQAAAKICKNSPAIFCYNLMNEPVASGEQKDKWMAGEPLAGKYYVQRLTTNMRGRTDKEIAKAWIVKLCTAIRSVDNLHMITVGVIPWEQLFKQAAPSAFRSPDVCEPLDFISIHYYPEEGKLKEDLANLKLYEIGKPLVIEEIFPLNAGYDSTEAFIKSSQEYVDGWFSFYWGTSTEEYEKRGDAKAIYIGSWLHRYTTMRLQVVGKRDDSR